MKMSDLNRCLLSAYRFGADHTTLKKLSTPAAHKIHSYLLRVANDSPDTYTPMNELVNLLKIPYSTAWRVTGILAKLGLIESRRGKPQRKGENQGAGGRGAQAWRAKL